MAQDFNPYTQGSDKDKDFDGIIRPQELVDFTGQEKIIGNLKIFIQAAKLRGESLDHVLFHGPPGLGKTTLAHIIANELGVNLKVTSEKIDANEVFAKNNVPDEFCKIIVKISKPVFSKKEAEVLFQ